MTGGDGNDWLSGGAGADTFYFDAQDGTDTIVSLDNDDKLIFEGGGSLDVEVINGKGEVKFGDTVINVEDVSTINAFADGASFVTSGDLGPVGTDIDHLLSNIFGL